MAERLVHHFVGCIHYARHIAAAAYRLVSHCETTELLHVGLEELERLTEQVETVAVQWQTLGEREGILYRQAHIGHTELRFHAAVAELHRTVHYRLRVDEHLNLLSLNAEEPLRLDNLEALVHHRRRVYRNLRSHLPCRMAQSVGSLHITHLVERELAERTARSGEQYLLYLVVAFAYKTLEDGRVLAVYGQDVHVVLRSKSADEVAGYDKCLLVGEADCLACLDGVDSWRESGETHHSRKHHVDRLRLYNLVDSLRSSIHLDVGKVGKQQL